MLENEKPRLYVYEWAAILCIIGFFTMICVLTQGLNQWKKGGVTGEEEEKFIAIKIEGAVENPGIHYLPCHSTIESALTLAKVSVHANVQKLNMEARLKHGQRIKVPSFPLVTIYIQEKEGKRLEFKLRKKTRIREIPSQIQLPVNVDLSQFNKKRYVKNHEVFTYTSGK